eukprot:1481123-Amphidinium_carterae.1
MHMGSIRSTRWRHSPKRCGQPPDCQLNDANFWKLFPCGSASYLQRLMLERSATSLSLTCEWRLSISHSSYRNSMYDGLCHEERYKGRLYVCCKFISVPQSLYLGADFCFMPSRDCNRSLLHIFSPQHHSLARFWLPCCKDEPFGYVDI